MHFVVLGAGLAGLSTAFELAKAGHKVTVLERQSMPGGMAVSWQTEGYWLDHGPHRFHSRDKELIRHLYEVLDDDVVTRNRLSRIYMQGKFFHYPLKTSNVMRLPIPVMMRCITDYIWIRIVQLFKTIPDDNFENWCIKRFGRRLYEIFFGTYTEKAWKMPCREISPDWASQRISQANLWDAIIKTLRPPKGGEVRSLVSEFWYPGYGGIGQIGRKYAEKVVEMGGKVLLDSPFRRLEVKDGRATRVFYEQDGTEYALDCDEVINTIPLPRLLEKLDPPPAPEVQHAIDSLDYVAMVFVYLEIEQDSVSPDHWVYLPEKHLTIHRISEFKNFNENAAPPGKTVICCEITCRQGDEHWNLTKEEAGKIAEQDLVTVGLIKPGISRCIEMHKLRHAYPVYDLNYKGHLNALKKAAKEIENLKTTGRQGLFRYNNMDHSIAMGRRVAKTLIKGHDAQADEVAAGQEYFG